MYDIWKEKKQGYRYRCCAMLYDLLYFCNRQEHEKQLSNKTLDVRIKTAANYIHSHFRHEQIEISRLAEMCFFGDLFAEGI